MGDCNECRMLTRRSFLSRAGMGLGGLALIDPILGRVASTFAQSSGGSSNLLVLCQLDGGLDVLSFLAPFRNSVYQEIRPLLALGAEDVTPVPGSDDYGISNLFPTFINLYGQGNAAIVQQVGYPDPNGSHFESQEIYKFGVRNLASGPGTTAPWYERLKQTYFDEPFGLLDTQRIGDPTSFGYPDGSYRAAAQDAFGRLARLKRGSTPSQQAVLDAYANIDELSEEIRGRTETFESTGEARGGFYRAAQLASAELGTQIIKLNYGGFDTHGSQDTIAPSLFTRVDAELGQFITDAQAIGVWERMCICFYSEFGRRNEENGSVGTDHGQGGHMILVGPAVNGGLHGQDVTSSDLRAESLPYYVDFRAVFSACIRDWLGFDPSPIFQIEGETYDEQVGSSLFT